MSLDAFVDEYHCTLHRLDENERSHQSALDDAHRAISDLQTHFAARPLLWRILTYIPYKFKCWGIGGSAVILEKFAKHEIAYCFKWKYCFQLDFAADLAKPLRRTQQRESAGA